MNRLVAAGNVEAPIYISLIDKGYLLRIENDNVIATKDNFEYYAENIIELAGIIFLVESRGKNWKVSDENIDNYLEFIKT